jgi:hypothetical protein
MSGYNLKKAMARIPQLSKALGQNNSPQLSKAFGKADPFHLGSPSKYPVKQSSFLNKLSDGLMFPPVATVTSLNMSRPSANTTNPLA